MRTFFLAALFLSLVVVARPKEDDPVEEDDSSPDHLYEQELAEDPLIPLLQDTRPPLPEEKGARNLAYEPCLVPAESLCEEIGDNKYVRCDVRPHYHRGPLYYPVRCNPGHVCTYLDEKNQKFGACKPKGK